MHGPWFKLGGNNSGKKEDQDKPEQDDSDDEEVHRAIVEAAREAEAQEGGPDKSVDGNGGSESTPKT
jgi:hypothetical protein